MKPTLFLGDCRIVLRKMEANSIDLVATDPPYFLDGLGDEWAHEKLKGRQASKSSQTSSVSSMPPVMKFKPEQGRRLQSFIAEVSMEVMRVLKPGGFFIAFACPRLYHRLAVAVEDAGFEIRDMLVWEHQGGQGKAFKLDHVVHGTREMSAEQQAALIASMEGRQTPQVKPRHEPFVLAQKPKNGNFIQNWERWQTGLVRMRFDGRQQDTVFEYNKPRLRKRHDHMTIKPQELMERIIEMFSVEGQVVLDPFMGSGTTGAAAQKTGRAFVGIEKEPDYFSQAEMRIRGAVV